MSKIVDDTLKAFEEALEEVDFEPALMIIQVPLETTDEEIEQIVETLPEGLNFGAAILDPNFSIQLFSEEELAQMGLQRIPDAEICNCPGCRESIATGCAETSGN